jgi:hypothetical protein
MTRTSSTTRTEVVSVSDRYTPDDSGAAAQPAPVEQPYYVPTAHQQAWSVAQQYPGQSYPAAQYGQGYPGQPWQGDPAGAGWGYGQYWTPPPVAPAKRGHRVLLGSVVAATATALAVGGIAFAVDRSRPFAADRAHHPEQPAAVQPERQRPRRRLGRRRLGR